MPSVSETIVREYFELHGFLARQERKYAARGRQEKDGIDFFVWNPQPKARAASVPFILTSEDLAAVTRAIVVVRGWHTESFGPALLENSPEMFRFVEPAVFEQAARSFGADGAPLKILVVPALAQTAATREQSIRVLRDKGVDAVIPFRTMLADLIAHTEVNRNYDKSDLLQVIRVLKNYDFSKARKWSCSARRDAAGERPGVNKSIDFFGHLCPNSGHIKVRGRRNAVVACALLEAGKKSVPAVCKGL